MKNTSPKKKSHSQLKKELDTIFSKWVRARDNHVCYTCGHKMEPNKSQAGHFVPRQYLSTRYDEANVHAQCWACNMLYGGQPSAYAARLERDYGAGIVEKLERKRKEIIKNFPFEEQIELYKKKIQAFQ